MTPPKRTLVTETSAKTSNKRARLDKNIDAPSTKHPKRSEKERVPSPQPSPHAKSHTQISILTKEQPAFPRGGAGPLTPFERKQINARAERDAVAEHNQSSDIFESGGGAYGLSEDDSDTRDRGKRVNKSQKGRKTGGQQKSVPKERPLRIEGLKYKHLAVGSLILGQITKIRTHELTVALPNNLTGFIPVTSISEQLNMKIGNLTGQEEINGTIENSDNEEDIDLEDYFVVGQYVRAAVTSTGDDSTDAKQYAKKRLILSLEPTLTNAGLTRSNLAIGATVQASVTSVEDHGIIVDLGIDDNTVKGFVSTKELDPSIELGRIKIGAVLLCVIIDIGSNGRTVKLSAANSKLGSLTKTSILRSAPTVDAFLPGTAVEILISEVTNSGLAGKIMGLLDVTADDVHSRAQNTPDETEPRTEVGKKVKGRLLYTFPLAETKKLGFSLLPNILNLSTSTISDSVKTHGLSISEVVPEAEVSRVENGLGVYLTLGAEAHGFAHISRLSDSKVDSISDSSGPYKVGSKHAARIMDYNPIDNLFLVSLQNKVINQPFLRVEDVIIGQVVKGLVSRLLVGEGGVTGLILELADGVTGLVPENHLSDIALQHPEKKFREGTAVKCRVLSTDPERRQIRLTLKKTLVNSDQKIWKNYSDITIGDSTPGTLVKVDPYGALVQFYGRVKGFLPVSEMSEAYIKDATEHFRVGQVVSVNAININPEDERLTVSCRDVSAGNLSTETALAQLVPGSLVNGTVFEKSEDDLLLRLEGSNALARLSVDHISDGSTRKRLSALTKIRVGQGLQNLLILDAQPKRRLVLLCNKASLVDAATNGTFLKSFDDLREGILLTGFVSNITTDGVFVGFAGGISGLIPKGEVSIGNKDLPEFGLTRLQPVTARVTSIDYRGKSPRFWLTMKESGSAPKAMATKDTSNAARSLVDPVDEAVRTLDDFAVGKVIKVRVVSVKETQINVELAKEIQGRIDISEIFDAWDQIKDRKKPLHNFSAKDVLSVRVLGVHDARNHRFLPISHRTGKNSVYELSMRPSLVAHSTASPVTMQDMKTGSSWLAYVNNVGDDCLWVNISPSVRGRIRAIDVSDDLSLVGDLEANFPVGSALRVRVISVDVEKSRLDLSGKQDGSANPLKLEEVLKGSILPGRVTKISDRQILVQISDTLAGAVDLIDLADDYSQANTARYQKNEVVRVCVLDVDIPNKKILLSMRPSKVLSSSLTVQDPEITSIDQLVLQEVYRGFIAHVADSGLFVTLGHGVSAFVRVSNLSDAYLKNWKEHFQRDQLVQGKVISLDKSTKHVQMSLKESVLRPDYKAPLLFTDLEIGQILTGKVVKVETFGVFVLVDNSEKVRGLCHRSEMADQRIEDASKLFKEGDLVKVKVLKVDLESRRVNFGMKQRYFDESQAGQDSDSDTEMLEVNGGVSLQPGLEDDGEEEDEKSDDDSLSDESMAEIEGLDDGSIAIEDESSGRPSKSSAAGLKVRGFDWFGISSSNGISKRASNVSDAKDDKAVAQARKKRKRAEIQIDRTGDLDTNGPQSVDDYERLLLGEPDSSLLWLQYMTFHLELGEIDQARQTGERALKSIGLAQDGEKLNIWIALINLENAYGDDDSVEEVFKRACEYNDAQDIHSRLTSIYIQSGKHDKADEMFQRMLKKFTQDPKIWVNYATFLMDTVGDAERARALLTRALQTLPKFTHLDLTSKFAQLEFRSTAGLPERGRTIFEGLFDAFPKRVDLFNVLLDLEMKLGDAAQVRALFERIFAGPVKTKPAKYFFKRWLEFEEKEGDDEAVELVKERARTFVRKASGAVIV